MKDDLHLVALESVYDRRLDAFVRTAAAITGSLESGRDAVHDAFVAAIRNRGQYRGEGDLEAWLWQIVVRAALRARRTASRQQRRDRLEPDRSTQNGHPDELSGLRATIALLPERQRVILFLRYYADLDYQQIADALGVRRGTVSAALHAAHTTLRRRLLEVPSDDRS